MYIQTWKTEGLGEQFVVQCDDYISFLFIFLFLRNFSYSAQIVECNKNLVR